MSRDRDIFPDCMHGLAAAFHRQRIDPQCVTICLPFDEWWKLANSLESAHRGLLTYDGRGGLLDGFKYMGFTFVPKGPTP